MKEKSEPVSGVAAPTGGSEEHPADAFDKFDGKRTFEGMTQFEVWEHGVLWADRTNRKVKKLEGELAALKALLADVRELMISGWDTGRASLIYRIDAALGEKTATKEKN